MVANQLPASVEHRHMSMGYSCYSVPTERASAGPACRGMKEEAEAAVCIVLQTSAWKLLATSVRWLHLAK